MRPEPTTDAPPPDILGRYARLAVWVALMGTFVGSSIVYAKKASEDRSAILRWLHQVSEVKDGVNIWDGLMFPNPPIFAITLLPLTELTPMAAALTWFWLKVGLAVATILLVFRMVRRPGDVDPLPGWLQLAILALSFRPILSDLHHANNNLIIMFLVVLALTAWRKKYDVGAGLSLALAIAYKVTPGLFLIYLLWKRSWRASAATGLGLALFLVIIPSAVLGTEFNGQCLSSWYHRILRPFVESDYIGPLPVNQSMPGVLARIFCDHHGGRNGAPEGYNLASLSPATVAQGAKILSLGFLGALLFLCRTKTNRRDDARLLGEFSLVVLTMLIVSERSWKHHFVTILLPYTYLAYRLWRFELQRWEWTTIVTGLGLSALMMLSTSTEVGGLFFGGEGHNLALYYGLFFWAGLVLYGLTAWRVWVERDRSPVETPFPGPLPHIMRKRADRPIRQAAPDR